MLRLHSLLVTMRTVLGFLNVAVVFLVAIFLLPVHSSIAAIQETDNDLAARRDQQIPLHFIKNQGQVNSRILFYQPGLGSVTYFLQNEITIKIGNSVPPVSTVDFKTPGMIHRPVQKQEVIRMVPMGINKDVMIQGIDKLPGKVNYFHGKSRAVNIPTYKKVLYTEMFDGIDVVFYGQEHQLEYDLILKPEKNFRDIRFALMGIQGLKIDDNGDLLIQLKEGTLVQHSPRVYQEINGELSEVNGRFRILEQDRKRNAFAFGFEIGKYDRSRTVTIDPIINYSTYFGGKKDDGFNAAATSDSADNIYLYGSTISTDLPTLNPIQSDLAGGQDIFITKLSPDGSSMIWSTYLGGTGDDYSMGLRVDANDNLWVSGATTSIDFPIQNPYQSTHAGGEFDCFLSRISSDGMTLDYSTYLGGSEYEQPVSPSFDSGGNVVLAGFTTSPNFPTTPGALDTTCGTDGNCNFDGVFFWEDVFVTRFSADGTSLTNSTFIGGSGSDFTFSFKIDGSDTVFIHGTTSLDPTGTFADFPIVNAYQPTFGGGFWDTFVLNLNATFSSLIFSTYFGGSGPGNPVGNDFSSGTNLVSDGIIISGRTFSPDFPTQNPLQGTLAGAEDGFLAKFSLDGSSLLYSTYFGGTGSERLRDTLTDTANNVWAYGITTSADFPTHAAIQPNLSGGTDGVVVQISPDGSTLLFSTYLGGAGEDQVFTIDSNSSGEILLAGITNSRDFPIANAIQSSKAGKSDSYDAFITKVSSQGFTEDFSDGNADGWTLKPEEAWTVVPQGSGFALTGVVPKKGEALSPEFILGVGTMSADLIILSAGAKVSILAWHSSKKSLLEIQFREGKDKIILKYKTENGTEKFSVDRTIDPNVLIHIDATFDGQNILIFLDGDPTPIFTVPATLAPKGKIGFRIKGTNASASITNITAN